jgi:2-polyprenyl-6-methoxyphenol hydroxylase-like FAD-dependent oxidoreductase
VGYQLIGFKKPEDEAVELSFLVDGGARQSRSVGADGIRSSVRKLLIGNDISPLRYLGCIVILGICPLSALEGLNSPLLDSTVFQTANGNEGNLHHALYVRLSDVAT